AGMPASYVDAFFDFYSGGGLDESAVLHSPGGHRPPAALVRAVGHGSRRCLPMTGYSAPATASAYRAPSTGRTVRAVMFDAFGTVVDWRSGISAAVRAFAGGHALGLDPEAFADAWRSLYQPAMERIRSGGRDYVSLDVLHRE